MEEMDALAELFAKVEATAFGTGTSTVSKDALRVNLTLPDGKDYVHVVSDAKLSKHEQALLDKMARRCLKATPSASSSWPTSGSGN